MMSSLKNRWELESYTKLLGKHKGESAFVIGSGTSLSDLDLSPIHDHVVITVNSSIMLMPNYWRDGSPDKRYWISNDAYCLQWSYWEFVKHACATKIVRESWRSHFKQVQGFLQFQRRPTPEHIINPIDQGLAYCSSVPSATDLALQMGCKKVFLLGVDHYQKDGKTYFWQVWDKEKPKRLAGRMALWDHQKITFAYNEKAYEALNKFANHLGAKIYNCNEQSLVNSLPKISFLNALERIGK